MTKENIIEKIGSILIELRNEYVTINQLQGKVDEIDLELFAANAVYLNQHIDILKKLLLQDQVVSSVSKNPSPQKEEKATTIVQAKESIPEIYQHTTVEPESFVSTQLHENDNLKHTNPIAVNEPSKSEVIAKENVKAELNSRFQVEKTSLNDRLSQMSSGKPHINESIRKQIKDIRAGIGLNEKFTFIRVLFNNDQKLYDQSLDQINSFTTMLEARNYINNELTATYHWNKKQETVEQFLAVLAKRFNG